MDSNASTKYHDVDQPALQWSPPPWHTQLTVALLLVYFIINTPAAIESMDEIANIETFLRTLFPEYLPLTSVILLRLLFSIILLSINIRDVLFCSLDFKTTYVSGSRLKPAIIKYRGLFAADKTSWRETIRVNTSFSSFSVALLGISFLLNGLIPLMDAYIGWTVPQNLIRLAVLLWTMAAPASLLVSITVSYVLWPQDIAMGNKRRHFTQFWILLMHTFNSFSSLVEVGLLGGLPCRLQDFAVAPMIGLVYILFSWLASHGFWQDDFRRDGPQFLYPFFDTTLGLACTGAIMGLFLVFILIYLLFSLTEYVLIEYVGGGMLGHGCAVLFLSGMVNRFRD